MVVNHCLRFQFPNLGLGPCENKFRDHGSTFKQNACVSGYAVTADLAKRLECVQPRSHLDPKVPPLSIHTW
ncbi:hypothetical protein SBV1_120005 [Verrucomicrobia bacterium]|nr:hypothetical protein SBV1_120005 [Verrucomicrobiota bacterium]